jgi:hypothetical protein
MLAWAGWFTICAFLVAVAPAQTQAVFSYVFHYELTGTRSITWTSYFLGMIGTTAWVGVFVASIGWCFHALTGTRDPGILGGRAAAQHS